MTTPRLAAQLYTVREFAQTPQDLAASLKKIRAIGYTAVQVSGIGPIPHADVKAMLEGRGIQVTAIKMGMDHSLQAWINDPDGNAIELMEYTHASLQLRRPAQ